jgi:hypothetical protein
MLPERCTVCSSNAYASPLLLHTTQCTLPYMLPAAKFAAAAAAAAAFTTPHTPHRNSFQHNTRQLHPSRETSQTKLQLASALHSLLSLQKQLAAAAAAADAY